MPPLVPDSEMSPAALKLKKFHDDFLMKHSSPMREKFIYEFGREAVPASWMPPPQPVQQQLASPSLAMADKDKRFETSNQCHYMSYEAALRIPSFRPEVKHRNLKSES